MQIQPPAPASFLSWREISYANLSRAGGGGSSQVFRVLATSGPFKGVVFALKVFYAPNRVGWRRQFMREINILRVCDHPSIMKVVDEGEMEDGRPFVVTEFLPETLKGLSRSALTILDKVGWTLQLLSALRYLDRHDPPLVHRDIKPANIFFNGSSCVLGDFGLILPVPEQAPSGQGYQPPKIAEMAQAYRTPELVEYHRTGVPPPPASDVFQLGLVVCEWFTGVNPCVHSGPAKPVQLRPIPIPEGPQGPLIHSLLGQMLTMDAAARPSASRMLINWQGLFLAMHRGRWRHPG